MMVSIMTTPTPSIGEAKKGVAELLVLALLADGDRHGYDLTKRIAARSQGSLTFNFASMYATLYKLEERGLVQGRWVERPDERRRRYYRITARGRDMLEAQRREWTHFFDLVRDLVGLSYGR